MRIMITNIIIHPIRLMVLDALAVKDANAAIIYVQKKHCVRVRGANADRDISLQICIYLHLIYPNMSVLMMRWIANRKMDASAAMACAQRMAHVRRKAACAMVISF